MWTVLLSLAVAASAEPVTIPAPPASKAVSKKESPKAMELKSPAFEDGAPIPARHTCSGEDLSPALAWYDVPKAAKSLALVMDDPDAPAGTWVHWVLYDLPVGSKGLIEGLPKKASLPNGARQGLVWGVEKFSRVGYHGPCPPPGKPHRYEFRLYALKEPLDLPAKASKPEVLEAMEGRVLAVARLTGTFKR